MSLEQQDLVYRLNKRAEIRRGIDSRRSVQEGKPDRIADLLEEAAAEIQTLRELNREGMQHIMTVFEALLRDVS